MKKHTKKAPHQFLVGYVGDGHCVYGRDGRKLLGLTIFTDKLTLSQARRQLRNLYFDRPKTIFKLVPVDENGEELE
ncbi:MAG: hypothetical protein PHU85_00685 [Phycisphaerae bacterium]|nr:hypothetical protein [Phycisphaerae bacterium]